MLGTHPIQQDKPVINGGSFASSRRFSSPSPSFLAVPALLAYYAKGDLLLPALAQYLLQGAVLAVILFIASRTDKSFYDLIADTLGAVTAKIVYILYALYFVFSALLPILDLERYVYTAFFDAAPSLSAFAPFFILSAFICTKNIKAFGRSADIAMPFFLVSFIGLMIMSVGQADFSNILPIFGTPVKSSAIGFLRTIGHFSDTALFLPLLGSYRYKKGDGKKVMFSYGLGALFVLFFLAVFYGVFGAVAPKQEFAFSKTAQYFQALTVVGRFDLLLIYLMTIVLLFYYCFVLQASVLCFAKAINTEKKVWISAILNVLLFLFALFFNKYYNKIYYLITVRLFWIFVLFADVVPLLCLFLKRRNRESKKEKKQGKARAKKESDAETGGEENAATASKVSAAPKKRGAKEATHA